MTRGSRRGPRGGALLLALGALAGALLAAAVPARAQDDGADDLRGAVPMRAVVRPTAPAVHLADPLTYRGWVVVGHAVAVKWQAPDRSGDLVWGPVRTGRVAVASPPGGGVPWPADTVWVEAPLQVFATGSVAIPGIGFLLERSGKVREGQLPVVNLTIASLLPPPPRNARVPANDALRPVRGPIRAPWWERVPWAWVIGGLLLAAAVAWVIARLRRRKVAAVAAAPAAPVRRRDPGAEALAELAALRRRELPASGRFAEHAFHLGRILRRYLEATVHVPRPGDTTPELIRHLRGGGFPPGDVERLTGLLRRWDAIKFARIDSDASEAERCEESVRDLVVRRARAPRQEVA